MLNVWLAFSTLHSGCGLDNIILYYKMFQLDLSSHICTNL